MIIKFILHLMGPGSFSVVVVSSGVVTIGGVVVTGFGVVLGALVVGLISSMK